MEVLAQLITLGVAKGSLYALLAVSFAIIFFTTRTFHLAHGAIFTLVGYSFYLFISILRLPLIVSIFLSFIVSVVTGVLIELFIYRPLRWRYASTTILLLSSLAILITAPSILAMLFTANPLFFPNFPVPGVGIGDISLSGAQAFMFSSLVFIGLVLFLLRRTSNGKLLQAVADRELVAEAIGIDISRVKLTSVILGSLLLVPAAILHGYDIGIIPSMGFEAILIASSCAVMGGAGNFIGAAVSGLIIGIAMRAGTIYISSSWQDGIAFLVLVLVVLFRPEGLFRGKIS
jgi:branched-subunit amino acid ABC-type transport system permease component